MLQAETKGKVCVHTLPHGTAVLKPASLLREGSDAIMSPRIRTPPLYLGGFRRCHMPRGSGPPRHTGRVRRCHTSLSTEPRLTAKEGSDTNARSSATDRTHLSGGLRCRHVSHGSPWVVGHRRGLSYNDKQRRSRVSKTRPRVTDVPVRRVGRRCYHDL
jgi:hypothetical protein